MRYSGRPWTLKLPAAIGENINKAEISINTSTDMASSLKCHNVYASITWTKIANVKSAICRNDGASPFSSGIDPKRLMK